MNIELFSSLVREKTVSDKIVETAFYMLLLKTKVKGTDAAVKLLREYRPEIASKMTQEAKKVIRQSSEELMEEVIDSIIKSGDEKQLISCIISIWDIHPELAKKMDKKHFLGIETFMTESKLLKIYDPELAIRKV